MAQNPLSGPKREIHNEHYYQPGNGYDPGSRQGGGYYAPDEPRGPSGPLSGNDGLPPRDPWAYRNNHQRDGMGEPPQLSYGDPRITPTAGDGPAGHGLAGYDPRTYGHQEYSLTSPNRNSRVMAGQPPPQDPSLSHTIGRQPRVVDEYRNYTSPPGHAGRGLEINWGRVQTQDNAPNHGYPQQGGHFYGYGQQNVVFHSIAASERRIAGREGEGEVDRLDPSFRIQKEPQKFFKVGKVFSLLWHEPAGKGGTELSSVTLGKFGEPVYGSIRRMVVVREQSGCCWCLPIHTYRMQGANKQGIDLDTHAVIYMKGSPPKEKYMDRRLDKEPLEVNPDNPGAKLEASSLLNFGKVYTVEHNVKVRSIGWISESSKPKLVYYWKQHS